MKNSPLKTEPIYLKKLIEKLEGIKPVADLLGMSGSGVSNALGDPEGVRYIIELAAKGLYIELFTPSETPTNNETIIVMGKMSKQDFEFIDKVAKSIGCNFVTV